MEKCVICGFPIKEKNNECSRCADKQFANINFEHKPMETKYEKLSIKIGQLVDAKNVAYGDSANTSAEAFKLLYPNGIKAEQYSDALLLVRIWDKMKRIATRKDAFGESPFEDIVGYSLIGAEKDKRE